jgi:hypothetical protein
VGELDPSGLGFRKMKEILKMFVHHIDHPVAERPKKKEGADETKDTQMAFPICPFEKPPLIRSA